MFDMDIFGNSKSKKGPKTARGMINKMLTGDGRKKPTLERILGLEEPKKKKKKSSSKKKKK
ncbi:conserved hypothetical protein [Methanocaldococcus sp. FS406-22]|uniref:hypothetical protein n=1 Tax=Methanocaldococcus sp. (strain FS406-22) TaxID=644281 RepID=UPI0001BF3A2B|nr:hypothetical protein [Methanocaldococcus sp. FS406-22]ADC68889.1 conserved hypothetical protein [Methanocaldococcus sp. FS406-22]